MLIYNRSWISRNGTSRKEIGNIEKFYLIRWGATSIKVIGIKKKSSTFVVSPTSKQINTYDDCYYYFIYSIVRLHTERGSRRSANQALGSSGEVSEEAGRTLVVLSKLNWRTDTGPPGTPFETYLNRNGGNCGKVTDVKGFDLLFECCLTARILHTNEIMSCSTSYSS